MKKLLCAMALVPMLVGAGCAGGSPSGSSAGGTSAATVVAWAEMDGCAKLIVSGPASKSIGYPNGPKDVICVSESTIAKLQAGDEDKERGTAKVTLGNLKKVSEGRYEVDILNATDVK